MHYRKVDPRIWNDAKFRRLDHLSQLAFLFLLTHPHLTSVGAMRASISGLCAESGLPAKAFRELFRDVERVPETLSKGFIEGFVEYDEKAFCLVIPNFIKYNPPENPNVVKGWARAADFIPESPLKLKLFRRLKEFVEGLGEGFAKAFPEPFRKGLANQEQEQEQEQEEKKKKDIVSSQKDDSTLVEIAGENGDSDASGAKLVTPEEIVDAWRRVCVARGAADIRDLTKARREKLKLRLAEHPTFDWWDELFVRITRSSFLFGRGDRGWKITFDWLIGSDTNGVRILEGVYDDDKISTVGRRH
jgi:hypothetical protein